MRYAGKLERRSTTGYPEKLAGYSTRKTNT